MRLGQTTYSQRGTLAGNGREKLCLSGDTVKLRCVVFCKLCLKNIPLSGKRQFIQKNSDINDLNSCIIKSIKIELKFNKRGHSIMLPIIRVHYLYKKNS